MNKLREENIIPLSMLKIQYLDKLDFKGSTNGMRYIIKKAYVMIPISDERVYDDIRDEEAEVAKGTENSIAVLRVIYYKDYFNFENTDKKEVFVKDFTYEKDSIEDALEYLLKNRDKFKKEF